MTAFLLFMRIIGGAIGGAVFGTLTSWLIGAVAGIVVALLNPAMAGFAVAMMSPVGPLLLPVYGAVISGAFGAAHKQPRGGLIAGLVVGCLVTLYMAESLWSQADEDWATYALLLGPSLLATPAVTGYFVGWLAREYEQPIVETVGEARI